MSSEPSPSPAPFKPGDIVRVRDIEHFIVSFQSKIKDRDALVLWVGPRPDGRFKSRAKVRFLKRNGRGKEFEEIMHIQDLVVQPRETRPEGG